MLIPTIVSGSSVLAVPGPSYWCSTSAHYYVNPPGVADEGCIWGDQSKNIGNWAPFVAGANTVTSGETFVTLGYNPVWESSALKNTKPTYGLKIECNGGGCNGLPCEINPSTNPVGTVTSPNAAVGAGGASFCVVTVPKGGSANIVVFDLGGGGDTGSAPSSSQGLLAPTTGLSSSALNPTTSDRSKPSETGAPFLGPGGIFHENGTSAPGEATTAAPTTTGTSAEATKTSSQKGDGVRQQGSAAIAGLIVAIIAAACLY
jgi:hypothetical protein